MRARMLRSVLLIACWSLLATGLMAQQQQQGNPPQSNPSSTAGQQSRGNSEVGRDKWRRPADGAPEVADIRGRESTAGNPIEPMREIGGGPRRSIARVTKGTDSLPNEHGQVWREYDITPYTSRVTTTTKPEQAIVDWILRETGYEAWHSDPLGILSPTKHSLRVYHTPEMQALVSEVVDRFIASEAESYTYGVRVATVNQPNWRAKAQGVLRPIAVQTPGASAWIIEKEDAALLLADLRKRSDYREHSSPNLMVSNGQSEVLSRTTTRSYVRDVIMRPESYLGFETQTATIDEGFVLEMSPLLSIDTSAIDVVLKCNIDQVKEMVPVIMDVPSQVGQRQRVKTEVPKVCHLRLHERFRWPADKVLIVAMGVQAAPLLTDQGGLLASIPFISDQTGADLLVFIEGKGPSTQVGSSGSERTGRREGGSRYGNRY